MNDRAVVARSRGFFQIEAGFILVKRLQKTG
jgi:hypothetical protein